MNKPTDHLVRTASMAEAGSIALSNLTGLSRLGIEMHRLGAGEPLTIPAGSERFLYVLDGEGSLSSEAETARLATGDFVALATHESAELRTDPGISILLGRSGHASTD